VKSLSTKRWFGIPAVVVAVVLTVVLLAGSAFAAYNFFGFTTNVTVDEPLSIEYNLEGRYGGDVNWHPLGDLDSQTIEGSAGDTFVIQLRINNRASGALIVHTVISGDDIGYFTFGGFPNGSIPGSDGDDSNPEWTGPTTIYINGDCPVNLVDGFGLTFTFTRE